MEVSSIIKKALCVVDEGKVPRGGGVPRRHVELRGQQVSLKEDEVC